MAETTEEQNENLTRVGRGTPMGQLLRRYWWPVGISADLKNRPTLIRVLSEDLVLFRDGTGKPGLLDALCSHRRANLCLGNVEKADCAAVIMDGSMTQRGRFCIHRENLRRANSVRRSLIWLTRHRSLAGWSLRISGRSPLRCCPGSAFLRARGSTTRRSWVLPIATGSNAWRTEWIPCT